MSGFFGLVKWGSKANKGVKAISGVAPKAGKDLTKKYLQSTQTKRNKAKIVQSQMKVEKDIEKGYKSVVDRNKSSKEVFKKSKGE